MYMYTLTYTRGCKLVVDW